MKNYKKVEKVRIIDELDNIICDCCGVSYTSEWDFNGQTSSYDSKEFTFELKDGSSYPEGNAGIKIVMDVCHKCRPKLLGLLNDNGFKTREVDIDEWR